MEEKFAIPGASAIIVKTINGKRHILVQERTKHDRPEEYELLEIPGGKIRENEAIFDSIRREVKEETGLSVIKIEGEDISTSYDDNGYNVIDFTPYCCTQNIKGQYPVICMVFICEAEGKLLTSSEEAKNYAWVSIDELRKIIVTTPEKIYPMDMASLKKFITDERV